MPLNSNAGLTSGYDTVPQVTTDGAGNWVAVWHSTDSLDGIGTDRDIFVVDLDQDLAVVGLQAGVVQGHFRGGRLGETTYLIDGLQVTNLPFLQQAKSQGLVDYHAGAAYPDAYGAAIAAFDRYLEAGDADAALMAAELAWTLMPGAQTALARARVLGEVTVTLAPIVVYSNKIFRACDDHLRPSAPLGLAIDLGLMYIERIRLGRACDAAALAGVYLGRTDGNGTVAASGSGPASPAAGRPRSRTRGPT